MLQRLALPLAILPLACSAPRTPPVPVDEVAVREGLNDNFLAEDLDVDSYVARFERESREVAQHHRAIVEALELRAGMDVADVGTGTGLFLPSLSREVTDGRVYAVDISEPFLDHIRERARSEGLDNVVPVLASERSCNLPERSVDVVFACDTYHHFSYPRTTLHSILLALRPGGRLVLVDFVRIPAVPREWILDHVRAGEQQVRAEVEAAGFRFDRALEIEGLEENYALQFVR